MNLPCIKCKGRNPENCGRSYCPIIAKSEAQFKVKKPSKKDLFGSSPTPFVGRFGYPNVNVGVLSVEDDSSIYDAPRLWSTQDFDIPRIVDLRSSLVNSRFKVHIKGNSKFLDISKEVGMASKPVEMEINLDKKPKFHLNTNPFIAPTGPNANLENARITANPKIPRKVERVVDETDLKAKNAITYLYDRNIDENFLTRLLSVGNLGVKDNRKLVPTRWSITAVDDIIGKELIEDVKEFSETDYMAYFGGYLGNYYLIMFFPDVWSYELFETYLPKVSWNVSDRINFTTDHEEYQGRTSYAENCAGGYYAARLPILEKLHKIQRQSTVIALRFITGDYYIPLGVWVVREATRKALNEKPIRFESRELMIRYAKALSQKKFGIELDDILKNSVLIKRIKTQKKLTDF